MDDFFDALGDFLDTCFGEVGVLFVSAWVLVMFVLGFGIWWEFIR